MIDMGIIDGKRVWYPGGKSLMELIDIGEVVALPDMDDGVAFKRRERCTPLELQAAYTPEEIRRMARAQGQNV